MLRHAVSLAGALLLFLACCPAGSPPCAAADLADPLRPGPAPFFRLRAAAMGFSGRIPGGLHATTTLGLGRWWAVDAGLGWSRPVGDVHLSTLAVPALVYAEPWGPIGPRVGAGWLWLPAVNDGAPLVSLGYQSASRLEEVTFSFDVTLATDRRFIGDSQYLWYTVGLMIGVPF